MPYMQHDMFTVHIGLYCGSIYCNMEYIVLFRVAMCILVFATGRELYMYIYISRSLRRFVIVSRMAKFTVGIICIRMFSIVMCKIP